MIGLHKGIETDYYDGARGIAVLFVWLSHASGRGQAPAEWLSFHGIGHVGVLLFFVLSGYLLAAPMARRGATHYGAYMTRRFFRIAPLYYAVLLSVVAWQAATGAESARYLHVSGGGWGLFRHLVFYQGDGIFWTIAAEFVFYLVLPLIALFVARRGRGAVILLLILSAGYSAYHLLIFGGVSELPGLKLVVIRHPSQFFDVFVVGAVFGCLSEDATVRKWYKSRKPVVDLVATGCFLLTVLATCILVAERVFIFQQPFYGARYFSFWYAVVFGLALLSAHFGNGPLRRIFRVKLFIFCGIVGYSWYLLHMPVLAWGNRFDLPPAAGFVVSSLLIAAVSLGGYLAIEEPFIRLGRTLSKRFGERPG